MKKVAVFTEGQTELIFVRDFILRLFDASMLSLECYELLAHRLSLVPFKYRSPSPEIHFMIVNVRGDEGVLSSIKEREKDLIEERGYEKIIGLRDMYCDKYCKLSPGIVNENVSRTLMQNYNATIQQMTHHGRIRLYFAIMEIEAWFLAMYNLFHKIDDRLTVGYIHGQLGIDLRSIDPQKHFFKPTEQIQGVFRLCGREYSKKQSDIEIITKRMELADLDDARENGRCSCLDDFYQEIAACG